MNDGQKRARSYVELGLSGCTFACQVISNYGGNIKLWREVNELVAGTSTSCGCRATEVEAVVAFGTDSTHSVAVRV